MNCQFIFFNIFILKFIMYFIRYFYINTYLWLGTDETADVDVIRSCLYLPRVIRGGSTSSANGSGHSPVP